MVFSRILCPLAAAPFAMASRVYSPAARKLTANQPFLAAVSIADICPAHTKLDATFNFISKLV